METEKEIIVGIGQLAVSHNPATLIALGLGSCVAVALYEKSLHIGGLAHIMLPDSREYAGRAEAGRSIDRLMKYSDVAIPKMIEEMAGMGAQKNNIHAKIIGGAQMFPSLGAENRDIGRRNIASVKKILQENDIPIDAEDTGGNKGRSISFDIRTQIMHIKTVDEVKDI